MLKNRVLLITGIASLITLGIWLYNFSFPETCNYSDTSGSTVMLCQNIVMILLPSVVLFLLILVFYFIKAEIIKPWLKYMLISVPISMVLVLLTPDMDNNLFPIDKARVSLSAVLIILIISFFIILGKSIQVYRKK